MQFFSFRVDETNCGNTITNVSFSKYVNVQCTSNENDFNVFRMALTSKTLITQPVHKLEASTVLTHSNPAQVSETFVRDY